MAIRAVLFDLGGVFLDWDPRHLYAKIFGPDVAGMEHFLATVCTPAWHARQDLGYSVARACAELAAACPDYAELVRAWEERSEEMITGVYDASVELLDELLSLGVPCYAFSNMERETWERRRVIYPFLQRFDGCFISGLEGVMKPSPQYFRRGLERFGLDPGEVVFIDDRPLNVEVAGALGITTVLSREPAALRRRLAGLGLLPGPGPVAG